MAKRGGKTVGVLGLTFKAETDDMRDSPSLSLIGALKDAGIRVKAYDPQGMEQARTMIDEVEFAETAYAAVEGVDAVVIATEWQEFRELDLSRVRSAMKGALFVDLRNLFSTEALDAAGFDHIGIGRRGKLRLADNVLSSHGSASPQDHAVPNMAVGAK